MTGAASLAMAVVALGMVTATTGQSPTFSTRTDAVEVDVLVTHRGRVVRGLQASDFEVRDNGKVHKVDVVTFEKLPLSVLLALDVSESLDAQRRAQLRRAGHLLLTQLTPIDEAGLLTFNERVRIGAPLSFRHDTVRAAFDLSRGNGKTSLIDACYAALTVAEGGHGRSLLIVFSDGVDSSSWLSPDAVLDVADTSDVVVYGVSVGPLKGGSFLPELAARTGGSMVEAASNDDLGATFLRILEEFRQRYVLTYTSSDPAGSGWHALRVRVTTRRATVQARSGYYK